MNDIQHALDVIGKKLKEMADEAGTPPKVSFTVGWTESTNIRDLGRTYYPCISLTATVEKTVNLVDL